MLSTIFYAFMILFETAASAVYFERILRPKRKIWLRILIYTGVFVLLFGCSLLHIYPVNLVAFVLSMAAIPYFLFKTKLRTCLFHTLSLSALMLITEFASIYLLSFVLKVNMDVQGNDFTVIVMQGFLSKILYFLALYSFARIAFRSEKRMDKLWGLALGFFPVASIAILALLYQLAVDFQIHSSYTQWYMIGTVLLLFSNLIVFVVYESSQKVSMQFIELQLETQKEKISSEYYGLLQEEYESSRILAHDLKGHFRVLKEMAEENRSEDIGTYIDNLSGDFRLNERIAYSGNRFADVIINRYAQLCREQGLRLDLDIRRVSLDFMSGSEITALLDNLLSNAVEAAVDSAKKHIDLIICEQNVNFVVIKLCNSADKAPTVKNGKLISRKSSDGVHGFGLKSIKRVAAKYDGEVKWEYKPNAAEFELRVILAKE